MAQFFVSTLVAMFVYPGGTEFVPDAQNYRFLENTFSELGMVYDFQGNPKPLSRWLFTSAMILGGLGLGLAHLVFPHLFGETGGHARRLARAAAILGSIIGLGFIGIGLFPTDTNFHGHFISVYVSFTGMVPTVALAALAIRRHPQAPKVAEGAHVAFLVVLLAYVALLWFGPGLETPRGNLIQVVGQKIIVYVGLLLMSFQTAVTVRLLNRRLRENPPAPATEATHSPDHNPERS